MSKIVMEWDHNEEDPDPPKSPNQLQDTIAHGPQKIKKDIYEKLFLMTLLYPGPVSQEKRLQCKFQPYKLGCQNAKTGFLEFTEIIAKILTKDSFWKDLILDSPSIKKAGMVQGSRNCCNFFYLIIMNTRKGVALDDTGVTHAW